MQIYDEPDLIGLGIEIAIEKFEELRQRGMKRSGIDFARDIQLKVYREATENKKRRFEVLFRACLLEEDKTRLQKFRRIEEITETDLARIEKILMEDAKKYLSSSNTEEILDDLKFHWENPSQMEEKILEGIINKTAVEISSDAGRLEWINNEITKELEERRIALERYLEAVKSMEEHISDEEFLDDLEKVRKHLLRLEKRMQEIIRLK